MCVGVFVCFAKMVCGADREMMRYFLFFIFLLLWANVQEWVQTLAERVVVVEEEAPDHIELKVMSLCRFIIVANSSFSWSCFHFLFFNLF